MFLAKRTGRRFIKTLILLFICFSFSVFGEVRNYIPPLIAKVDRLEDGTWDWICYSDQVSASQNDKHDSIYITHELGKYHPEIVKTLTTIKSPYIKERSPDNNDPWIILDFNTLEAKPGKHYEFSYQNTGNSASDSSTLDWSKSLLETEKRSFNFCQNYPQFPKVGWKIDDGSYEIFIPGSKESLLKLEEFMKGSIVILSPKLVA